MHNRQPDCESPGDLAARWGVLAEYEQVVQFTGLLFPREMIPAVGEDPETEETLIGFEVSASGTIAEILDLELQWSKQVLGLGQAAFDRFRLVVIPVA